MDFAEMGAGHFIYIPAVLLVGIVIGWILGSRAAADAYAAEMRRREERARRQERASGEAAASGPGTGTAARRPG
jgi:hypothetical protein